MDRLTKVLFIGLDSAEPELIRQWMEEGLMPTFRSLHERGAWSDMSNPPGLGNSTLWSTLATAVNPGVHSHYFGYHFRPDSYRATLFRDDEFAAQHFWSTLSRAGKRVAVFDWVWGPLCRDLNGIQLVDYMAHAPRHRQTLSWPPELAAEVTARYGSDPMRQWRRDVTDAQRAHKILRDQLVERTATKAELTCHYLEQGGWDLFITVFGEPHDVGHEQWHLHDPSHPLHDADWARKFGDPIKDVYIELDKAIGRILDCAGPEATAFVFTGPGTGPNYTGNHLLDEILRRLVNGAPFAGGSSREALRAAYRRLVPAAFRSRLETVAGRWSESMSASGRHGRKAFAVPNNDNSGAIRINLAGRDSHGIVQPGAEYEALCEEITNGLLEIDNLETGKPLVEQVVRVADLCHGHRLDGFPDLLVPWRRDGPIGTIRSPKLGELSQPYSGWRTGDHTRNCLLLARGPAIRPGRLDPAPRVTDLAPTLAALLGVTLPDVEGIPVAGLAPNRARPVAAEAGRPSQRARRSEVPA